MAAPEERPAPPGAGGGRRHASARRPGSARPPRQARAPHDRRPPLAPAAAVRAARRRATDQGPLRRRGGRDRRSRAGDFVAPRPRTAPDPHGESRRRHRRDQGDVVQPALARGPAAGGHEGPAARQAQPVRLPGGELRPRRRRRDGRLCPRLSRERGTRAEAATRPGRGGARARPGRGRRAPGPARSRRGGCR